MKWLLLWSWLLPLSGWAQARPAWGGGIGVGNGVQVQLGRQQGRWLSLGRVRYRWWGPSDGPGSDWQDEVNTKARQVEVAAMAGYGLPVGRNLLYGSAGLSYLNGRQLGEYRYAISSGGLVSHRTYYFSYRDYQALGLPLEVGWLRSAKQQTRFGLALQADFNPERTLYGGLLTLWIGRFGSEAAER